VLTPAAGPDRPKGVTPEYAVMVAREEDLSRLLILYVTTGLVFMLLPGTFLGVWNLVRISSRQAASSISPDWIQAHGHAQVFGWVCSFILGIGFYSIPKLTRSGPFSLASAWACWALWAAGVSLRWATDIYQWHWRALLPFSAALELAAFLIFFRAVSGHRRVETPGKPFEIWILIVIAATIGLLATVVMNVGECAWLSWKGSDPAFPRNFDQRFLVISTWGSLVPLVWGFTARWMPVFLGLRALRGRLLLAALALNSAGVIVALAGWSYVSVLLLLAGAVLAPLALRLFEGAERAAKTRGVHPTFPYFVRLAYSWLIVGGSLAIWAAIAHDPPGVWGASRHAVTVGFIAMMVFSVGQRVLPTFSGRLTLFSTRLMFLGLAALMLGCTLRVTSEVLAYQDYAVWAWRWLPVSAVIELAAVTIFGVNMALTFLQKTAAQVTLPTLQRAPH
jgi:uncharacterized protein involved in response to NO